MKVSKLKNYMAVAKDVATLPILMAGILGVQYASQKMAVMMAYREAITTDAFYYRGMNQRGDVQVAKEVGEQIAQVLCDNALPAEVSWRGEAPPSSAKGFFYMKNRVDPPKEWGEESRMHVSLMVPIQSTCFDGKWVASVSDWPNASQYSSTQLLQVTPPSTFQVFVQGETKLIEQKYYFGTFNEDERAPAPVYPRDLVHLPPELVQGLPEREPGERQWVKLAVMAENGAHFNVMDYEIISGEGGVGPGFMSDLQALHTQLPHFPFSLRVEAGPYMSLDQLFAEYPADEL